MRSSLNYSGNYVFDGLGSGRIALPAVATYTVVRFLIRDHVSPGRLAASGYGANHPLTSNASADGRARNRRVEIVLTRQN